MLAQYLAQLAFDTILGEAQKIHIVDDTTVYYGYCANDCKGTHDTRWIIKRLTDNGSEQTIEYANGEKKSFTQAWDERESLDYKLTAVTE